MSVLKCVLFFVAVSSVFGCDNTVDLGGDVSLKSDACGVNDLVAFKCSCPWTKCATTKKEFLDGIAEISAGTATSFGLCEVTGFTIAFSVIGGMVFFSLIFVCTWVCCCKGQGCAFTPLFAGGCCCDKSVHTTARTHTDYNTVQQ